MTASNSSKIGPTSFSLRPEYTVSDRLSVSVPQPAVARTVIDTRRVPRRGSTTPEAAKRLRTGRVVGRYRMGFGSLW